MHTPLLAPARHCGRLAPYRCESVVVNNLFHSHLGDM